jgi:hypothetical protein
MTSGAALFRNKFFVENEYFGIPDLANETFPMQHDPFKETGEGFDAYMEKYKKQVSGSQNSKEKLLAFGVDKGHENMLNTFVDSILNDKASPCDEIAGLQSTCLAKLAIQSIETRQVLPVPVDKIRPAIV